MNLDWEALTDRLGLIQHGRQRCHEILEERERANRWRAFDLLQVVADGRVLAWLPDYEV